MQSYSTPFIHRLTSTPLRAAFRGLLVASLFAGFLIPLAAIGAPTISATQDDGTAAATRKLVGQQIDYTTVISNTAAVIVGSTANDATSVILTNNTPANTTDVGTVTISPIAFDDDYPQTIIGNVSINSANIPYSVFSNDFAGTPAATTISAFDATSVQGGQVTMVTAAGATLGQFTYNPPPGFEGTDTFTYTLTNSAGSSVGTVRLTVTGMVWFINNAASACTTVAAGCGRLSNPFSTLAAFNSANGVADAGLVHNPAANDNIFIFESATGYSGAVTLVSGQKLIGQDATATLAVITGLTPPSGSAAFPAMNTGGNNSTITSTVTLNTNTTVRGLSISSTTNTGMNDPAGAITGVNVSEVDVTTTTGTGVSLANIAGTLSFDGLTTSGGTGADLTGSNGSATFNFTGVTISSGGNTGFNATGGGTVNITGASNTLTSTTGVALNVVNTTIGASGLTFRSISVTGNNTLPASGIILNTTGSGGLKVTGNAGVCTPATQTCTGGTIQGTGSHGVNLTAVSNIEFNLVSIKNTGDHGLFGDGVNNFTLRDSIVFNFGNASASGPGGPSEDGLHFESTNNANTAAGHGLTGTVTFQRNTIGPDGHFVLTPNPPTPENKGIVIRNHNDVNLAMTVTGMKFFQISNDGIDADVSDGTATLNVDGSTADGANDFSQINGRAVTFQGPVDNAAARVLDLTIKNNTFTSVGIGGRWLAGGRCTMNARFTNNVMTSTTNDAIRSIADASIATLTPHATTNATITGNNFGGGSAFIAHHRQAVGNIAFNNNTNIGNVGGILVTAEVRSTVGIDILSNSATVSGNAGRNALYIQTANNGVAGTDNSTICANISGNNFSESPNNTGFQSTIVLDTVSNQGVINLENWNGSSPTYDVFLSNQNTLSGGTPNVIADNPANIHAGANCVTSTPLMFASGGVPSVATKSTPRGSASDSAAGEAKIVSGGADRREDAAPAAAEHAKPEIQSATLTREQIESIVVEAKRRWAATGLSSEQGAALDRLQFDVADLAALYLGSAGADHIKLNRKAGDQEWFVDAPPMTDGQFGKVISATQRFTEPEAAPAGRVDLLTAIMHEMGHALGLPDSYDVKDRENVMYGFLTSGERRLPANGQAIGAVPGSLSGAPHFLGSPVNIGTLPPNKSVTIKFSVTVGPITGNPQSVSSQGTVSGSNFANVLTDDPTVGGGADPTVTLLGIAPAFTSANATTFTVGTNGNFSVTANGAPPPTFTKTGTLPTGVTLDSNGLLHGTPAAGTGGTYPITITATNAIAPDAMQSFTLTVNQPPAVTSANNTTFTVGTAGTFTVTTTGFPTGATMVISETGALPSGVTFTNNNDGTATLAGTPGAGTGGTYPITITANNGVAPNGTQSFTLTVNQAPAITSAANTTFTVGTAGTFSVTTTGFPTNASMVIGETGALPSGVTFTNNNNGTATLAGTPGAGTGGTYPITITANNGVGSAAMQSFTLTVNQAPAITSANNTTFT
ncbi:MAG TPA: putative Ig domain-containing protein, partial [Chthoniobacterales bacterium]|nr:putative Ig domain-containing protein [Chthoniobacterales bacterium]